MTSRPVLFSGPMVRAILDGRKTQTRRIISGSAGLCWFGWPCDDDRSYQHPQRRCQAPAPGAWHYHDRNGFNWGDMSCPYGVPGDTLWVRETWRALYVDDPEAAQVVKIEYAADGHHKWRDILGEQRGPDEIDDWCERWVGRSSGGWQPSIYMPRWASRLTLRVESVRVERLQEISGHDAVAEGIERDHVKLDESVESVRQRYAVLWDRINGKRAPWASNPWVWAVGFPRVSP